MDIASKEVSYTNLKIIFNSEPAIPDIQDNSNLPTRLSYLNMRSKNHGAYGWKTRGITQSTEVATEERIDSKSNFITCHTSEYTYIQKHVKRMTQLLGPATQSSYRVGQSSIFASHSIEKLLCNLGLVNEV